MRGCFHRRFSAYLADVFLPLKNSIPFWYIKTPAGTQLAGATPISGRYTPVAAKSGSVDMYGAVQMPKKAKIEVSGQLYARSADIQCANPSDNWQGVRVKSGGLLYLENATISSYDIIMEPGSTLILSGSIEFKNGHKAVLGSGVYVCVASSFTDKSVSKSFYVNGVPSMVLKNGKASGVTSKYAVTCSSIGWQRFLTRCTAIEDILYVQNKTLTQECLESLNGREYR